MLVTTKIDMDLARMNAVPIVRAVQGDLGTRAIEMTLYSNGEPWTLPEEASIRIRYSKNDGTGGVYDTLPDGSYASKMSPSALTVMLAPQLLNTPGKIELQVTLIVDDLELTTFSVFLVVQPNPSADTAVPEDYVSLSKWLSTELQKAKDSGEFDGMQGEKGENGADGVDGRDADSLIPDYVRRAAEDVAEKILGITGEAAEGSTSGTVPFSFAFLTDLHWRSENSTRVKAAAQALKVIGETAPLDLICFGGDYVHNWAIIDADTAREYISACRRMFTETSAPALWLRGDHDGNGYDGERLDRAEIYNRISRCQYSRHGYVTNHDDPYGCYGYMDFENAKVRVITVNTSDNDQMGTTENKVNQIADLFGCHNIGAKQLQWIADRALDLSGKEDPETWTVLFLSHNPIYSENSWYNSHSYTDGDGLTWECNVINLEELVAAYRDKGSFTVSLNGESVSADFSGAACAGNILFVNGHGHALTQTEYDGFTFITCPNLCSTGEEESDDGVTYTKTDAGTAGETAFSVLTVDSANRTVHAWIYGAGYDRSISI